MAIEKTLNTRILMKVDTLENWDKSTLALKKGELAFATVAATAGNGLTEPVVMVKIGEDGVKTFNDLSWNFYAKASDVIAAAKSEDTLRAFINGVITDAGVATDDALKTLSEQVTANKNDIATLKGDASTEGSVAKAIKDAIDALNLVDTYAAKVHGHEMSEVNGLADALAGLQAKGDYAAEEHTHEIADVTGLSDAIADAKKAGTDANAALETYKTTNDAAVKKVADDLAAETEAARAAEKANADAIAAIKDHASVDSFADVMAEIAKKQDIIPENTYDAHGAAAQALTDAKAYTDEKDEAMDARVDALEAKFGDGEGNVESQIADAVAAEKERAEGVEADLQEAIDAINNAETGILAQAKAHADGKDEAIAAAQKAGDDAIAEAQKKVASVTAGDASVTVAGTATTPTVAVKLDPSADNALKLNEAGLKVEIGAAPEYTIVKAEDSGEFAAVYNLTKDGTIVGASINIPKDIVVKSGSVVGDEIVLVLNDEEATEIKIPVASLIEYVTSGSAAGDMVVVNVSDDHKVTATITDGTITLAKLATDVQTAIGKAHSHENATVLDGINADKVAAWDAAEANAIAKANELNGAMNTRVEALEAIDHEHANKALLDTYTQTEADLADAVAKKHSHANAAELDKFVDGDKAKLDSAVQTVTAAADSGLKATRTGNDIAIEIDESVTFIFDCGNSGVTA